MSRLKPTVRRMRRVASDGCPLCGSAGPSHRPLRTGGVFCSRSWGFGPVHDQLLHFGSPVQPLVEPPPFVDARIRHEDEVRTEPAREMMVGGANSWARTRRITSTGLFGSPLAIDVMMASVSIQNSRIQSCDGRVDAQTRSNASA